MMQKMQELVVSYWLTYIEVIENGKNRQNRTFRNHP